MCTAADKEDVAVEKVFEDSENAQSEKSKRCIRYENLAAQSKTVQNRLEMKYKGVQINRHKRVQNRIAKRCRKRRKLWIIRR